MFPLCRLTCKFQRGPATRLTVMTPEFHAEDVLATSIQTIIPTTGVYPFVELSEPSRVAIGVDV